ncbi:uncharacterized protein LOC118268927 [Spodoptera frugiperda]|uniref:Uncharacterized protein LOC118268927 n=1 Tax=Spodoptera frugiperda TaxID=7108 RepID=A0A9R0D4B4_SPOFR|nr:uncharacterized protein LOC118268927 [Spodoptera frugiperda]
MWVANKTLQVRWLCELRSSHFHIPWWDGFKMANYLEIASSTDSEWIEVLCKEYQREVREYARWPVLLLQSNARRLVWAISGVLGVAARGVPGSSCRLLEHYLSRKIEQFFQQSRNTEEWDAYKNRLAARFILLAVSCIQLTAKMQDLMAPLTASLVRSSLMKEGIDLSREDIVAMEFHVFRAVDFTLPLWTSLEISEFLATQVGLVKRSILEAVGLITNITEFYRDELELQMKGWLTRNPAGTPITTAPQRPSPDSVTIHNLHMCAGVVLATARYFRSQFPDLVHRMAILIRTIPDYIQAISDYVLNNVIEDTYVPTLKKRRLR